MSDQDHCEDFSCFEIKSFGVQQISLSSYQKAERYWLMRSMEFTRPEVEKGRLVSLRPKVENGIIVISSRAMTGMKLNYNEDMYPILTEKDPVAKLWIREIHEEDHSGVTRTVAKSRRKFWVIRARKVAQKIRNSCFRCRLLDKKLESQQMAPLPTFRQSIAPVFNVTSIDLFGPFMIKDMVKKRTRMKVWGLVATCACTRAVYLDLVDGYSTDSVLQTLRKFVTMRGCPSKFIADQGTQLTAAAKDLSDTGNCNWSKIVKWATSHKSNGYLFQRLHSIKMA